MKVTELPLAGLKLVEPDVFGDERGFFMETWQAECYREHGIDADFVQDNLSRSGKGVIRGLHFQNPNAQGKLVQCLEGEVFDVAVDIRRDSLTFGHWHAEILTSKNRNQLWVPPGFAHGFMVVSETAMFSYKCDALYDPASEFSIHCKDPVIGIEWPIQEPSLSEKDATAPTLEQFPRESLPLIK